MLGAVPQRRLTRWRLTRLVLVLVVVCAGCAQGHAASSTFTSTCRGVVLAGCVETRTIVVGPAGTASPVIHELQMNLCNSGMAECYRNDRSPAEAAGLITRYTASVVTLNEICADNVLGIGAAIPSAMAAIARQQGDATVFAVFTPAVNRYTEMPYRCVNGDMYGIGIVGRGTAGVSAHYLYRRQYTPSDEERAAVCVVVGDYDICTTHLESDNSAVAIGQCHELMDQGGHVGDFRGTNGARPTVVAGDFNLALGGTPDIRDCVPPDWVRRGDGGVQHVLATGLRFTSTRTVHMRYTDHPALVTELTHG
jgi:hypothetical protein